jgi:hypothetical protein
MDTRFKMAKSRTPVVLLSSYRTANRKVADDPRVRRGNIAALIAIGTLVAFGIVVDLKLVDAPKIGGCRLSGRLSCADHGILSASPPAVTARLLTLP